MRAQEHYCAEAEVGVNFVVAQATRSDLPLIRELLEGASWPVSDISDEPAVRFWVARNGALIGAIGLERFGSAGLLRSLVVAPHARRHGLGDRLLSELERTAVADGLRQLVLLTQTAEKFFAHRGYAAIDRALVPTELRESSEFMSLCPASATCMSKALWDRS
jgi:amino-acid N-acetyltransferase